MTPSVFQELPPDRLEGDVVAALFFEDQPALGGAAAILDRRLDGVLSTMIEDRKAFGRVGENILVRRRGQVAASWILFAGGGLRGGLGVEAFGGLLRYLIDILRKAGFVRIAFALEALPGVSFEECRKTVAELAYSKGGDLQLVFGVGFGDEADISEPIVGGFG